MISSSPLIAITVINDFTLYDRFFVHNPNLEGCDLYTIDNRTKNESLTVCYNRAIREISSEQPRWFMFVHQDFELLEPLLPKINLLDKQHIYGPYGAKTKRYFGLYYRWMLSGQIYMSCRDGSSRFIAGNKAELHEPTETFDCCCLFVHSDWIKKTGFRFDENLTFDLYGEDLCIQAQEYYHTKALIIPLQAQHYAFHPVPPRYYAQEAYLNKKYSGCCYTAQCSHYIGNPNIIWKAQVKLKKRILSLTSWMGRIKKTIGA